MRNKRYGGQHKDDEDTSQLNDEDDEFDYDDDWEEEEDDDDEGDEEDEDEDDEGDDEEEDDDDDEEDKEQKDRHRPKQHHQHPATTAAGMEAKSSMGLSDKGQRQEARPKDRGTIDRHAAARSLTADHAANTEHQQQQRRKDQTTTTTTTATATTTSGTGSYSNKQQSEHEPPIIESHRQPQHPMNTHAHPSQHVPHSHRQLQQQQKQPHHTHHRPPRATSTSEQTAEADLSSLVARHLEEARIQELVAQCIRELADERGGNVDAITPQLIKAKLREKGVIDQVLSRLQLPTSTTKNSTSRVRHGGPADGQKPKNKRAVHQHRPLQRIRHASNDALPRSDRKYLHLSILGGSVRLWACTPTWKLGRGRERDNQKKRQAREQPIPPPPKKKKKESSEETGIQTRMH